MNRYIVRATRVQTVEIMVTGWDEDDAFEKMPEDQDGDWEFDNIDIQD